MKILRNVIVCRQVKINLRSFPTVSPNIVEDIFFSNALEVLLY